MEVKIFVFALLESVAELLRVEAKGVGVVGDFSSGRGAVSLRMGLPVMWRRYLDDGASRAFRVSPDSCADTRGASLAHRKLTL